MYVSLVYTFTQTVIFEGPRFPHKKYGMKVMMHVGGTSVPGSSTVTCDDCLIADPTVACHLNGGPTSISVDEARRVIDKTACAIEIVHCGNLLSAFEIVPSASPK